MNRIKKIIPIAVYTFIFTIGIVGVNFFNDSYTNEIILTKYNGKEIKVTNEKV